MEKEKINCVIEKGLFIVPKDYKVALEKLRECFLNVNGENLIMLQNILELLILSMNDSMDCFQDFKSYYENEFKPIYREFKKECFNYIKENSDIFVLKEIQGHNKFLKYLGYECYLNTSDIVIGNRFCIFLAAEDTLDYIYVTKIQNVEIAEDKLLTIHTANSIYIFERC